MAAAGSSGAVCRAHVRRAARRGGGAAELALSMIEPLSSRIERRGVHAKIVLF